MTSPNGASSHHQASERTPLLRPKSSDRHHHKSAIHEDDIQAAEVVGEGALEAPRFGLGKTRSYSHSHWLAPDEDSAARPEPDDPHEFGEDGLLAGITRTKFRFIFGGILLGYFVS